MDERLNIAMKMAEQMRGQNQQFMTEVAMPGCRPDDVKDSDIADYITENKSEQ